MPETSAQWFERVAREIAEGGMRQPAWPEWDTWPLEGDVTPRPLLAPIDEGVREGVGGTDCGICERLADQDSDYVFWRDDTAVLARISGGTWSLPFGAFLMPRRHADLGDLSPGEAARFGELQVHIERAVTSVLDVPRVQMIRWGDGAEHLHWWLMARPTGMQQMKGMFVHLWEGLLPKSDPARTRHDQRLIAERMVELAGGEIVSSEGSVGGAE